MDGQPQDFVVIESTMNSCVYPSILESNVCEAICATAQVSQAQQQIYNMTEKKGQVKVQTSA